MLGTQVILTPSDREELNKYRSTPIDKEKEVVCLFIGGLENYTLGWYSPFNGNYCFIGSREMRDYIARSLPSSLSKGLTRKILQTVQHNPKTGLV